MSKIVDIHCHRITDHPKIIEILIADTNFIFLKSPPIDVPICVGLHPWQVEDISYDKFLPLLKQYLTSPSFYALGEIGLDKLCKSNYEKQIKIFTDQLTLAKKLKLKRVIIHSVRAHSDILSIFKNLQVSNNFLIHDFYGSIEIARQYLKYNCYFSFGKKLFNNPNAQKVITQLPIERVLLETDDQVDYSIFQIYKQASLLLKIESKKLKNQLFQNYHMFGSI